MLLVVDVLFGIHKSEQGLQPWLTITPTQCPKWNPLLLLWTKCSLYTIQGASLYPCPAKPRPNWTWKKPVCDPPLEQPNMHPEIHPLWLPPLQPSQAPKMSNDLLTEGWVCVVRPQTQPFLKGWHLHVHILVPGSNMRHGCGHAPNVRQSLQHSSSVLHLHLELGLI